MSHSFVVSFFTDGSDLPHRNLVCCGLTISMAFLLCLIPSQRNFCISDHSPLPLWWLRGPAEIQNILYTKFNISTLHSLSFEMKSLNRWTTWHKERGKTLINSRLYWWSLETPHCWQRERSDGMPCCIFNFRASTGRIEYSVEFEYLS